jgi:hypothetical protein
MLEAEKKLQGAKYHLDRMRETYLDNETVFIYELESFLAKIRSVLDVLLEDYNKIFSLGISLQDKLYPKIFEKKAKQMKLPKAISFIKWWKNEMNNLRTEPLGSIIIGKRNVSIHRVTVTPNLKKISITETIRVSTSVTVTKIDSKGNVVEVISSSNERPKTKTPDQQPKIEWCFKEYPSDNVLNISEQFFNRIKKLVDDAKKNYHIK